MPPTPKRSPISPPVVRWTSDPAEAEASASTNAAAAAAGGSGSSTRTNSKRPGKAKASELTVPAGGIGGGGQDVAASALADVSAAASLAGASIALGPMPRQLTLITFNSYLFPKGLRHSFAYANKWERAKMILKHMRRHRCTEVCAKRAHHNGAAASSSSSGAADGTADPPEDTYMSSPDVALKNRRSPSPKTPSSPSIPLVPSDKYCASQSLLAADIVCLQEVLGSVWCKQWQQFFRALTRPDPEQQQSLTFRSPLSPNSPSLSPDGSPLLSTHNRGEYEIYFTPRPRCCAGSLIDSGLMIASRYPILHAAFRSFKHSPLPMKFVDKGFQHVVLDIEHRVDERPEEGMEEGAEGGWVPERKHRRILHVINTHLHPHEASLNLAHGQRVRRDQQIEIREYLLSTTDDTSLKPEWRFHPTESALICTGDLNTEQGSDACTQMREILDCPNYSAIKGTEPTMHNSHGFCNHPVNQTICGDYAISNQHVRMSRGEIIREAKPFSDHYPVKCFLEMA